ncbi:MAG: hypothetical protein ACLFWL_12565 [Candidatus Brocadiia bacterium]
MIVFSFLEKGVDDDDCKGRSVWQPRNEGAKVIRWSSDPSGNGPDWRPDWLASEDYHDDFLLKQDNEGGYQYDSRTGKIDMLMFHTPRYYDNIKPYKGERHAYMASLVDVSQTFDVSVEFLRAILTPKNASIL